MSLFSNLLLLSRSQAPASPPPGTVALLWLFFFPSTSIKWSINTKHYPWTMIVHPSPRFCKDTLSLALFLWINQTKKSFVYLLGLAKLKAVHTKKMDYISKILDLRSKWTSSSIICSIFLDIMFEFIYWHFADDLYWLCVMCCVFQFSCDPLRGTYSEMHLHTVTVT